MTEAQTTPARDKVSAALPTGYGESEESEERPPMTLSLKALLLIDAIVMVLPALILDESQFTLLVVGLALLAGALLVEDLGVGRRRRLIR